MPISADRGAFWQSSLSVFGQKEPKPFGASGGFNFGRNAERSPFRSPLTISIKNKTLLTKSAKKSYRSLVGLWHAWQLTAGTSRKKTSRRKDNKNRAILASIDLGPKTVETGWDPVCFKTYFTVLIIEGRLGITGAWSWLHDCWLYKLA